MTEAAIFLVVTVDSGAEDVVAETLPDFTGLVRSVASRSVEAHLTCVVGIGSALWDRLFSGPRPDGLHPFIPLAGDIHTAPSTPGDMLFHIRGGRMDVCFEMATQLMSAFGDGVRVVDEVHGFRYFDMRDIIGFVDGTENPDGPAATVAVSITDEPDFVGGSYVIVQKYLHDMDAWNALSTEEQENAIGRSKWDNIEQDDDTKPTNSHTALTVIEDENGVQQQIMRDNMPFGRVGSDEFGTYFIGYAAHPSVTEEMLTNMFIGKPPGNHDRILDFSTAVTGGLFFVPSVEFLDDPPLLDDESATDQTTAEPDESHRDADPSAAVTPSTPSDPGDGSLGIGALKPR
ncbi:Dyp-type peroxidase [Gordonia jinhuaensis]|uniref:Peroxidase n=2 Tax=Gordonia jinhuaensis TaxID=1517702 RepID=A0A916WWX5_9ACTN|nr:peroxidase [Gordonia jinhuaensis]